MKFLSLFFFIFFPLWLQAKNLTILHTNDLHSYFLGTLKRKTQSVERVGGYDFLAQRIIDIQRELEDTGEPHLLLDAGDFFSGTLFHSLVLKTDIPYFPEYEFFNFLKFDGITLGNHEFDGGDSGFAAIMDKVRKLGNKVPIISTNYINKEGYPILKAKLLEVGKENKIKVGLLGALGPDGCSVSKGNRTKNNFVGYNDKKDKDNWDELIMLLEEQSRELRAAGAEIVILMLHGGTGEDDKIAKGVSTIDVIIAGHTHEVYLKEVRNMIISQSGNYGSHLGILPVEISKDNHVSLRDPLKGEGYHLPITQSSPANEEYGKKISLYQREIRKVLSKNDFPPKSGFKFIQGRDLSRQETGSLVTTAIQKGLSHESNIQFYFTAKGLIRNSILGEYEYDLYDFFNILPIGFHGSGKLGFQSLAFYLKAKDVYRLFEFLSAYSSISSKAEPVFSDSLKIKFRKWGIPFFNKVEKITINGKEIKGLVKVGTNTFLYRYLEFIQNKTFGLVKIEPVNEKGDPLKIPELYKSEIYYFLRGANQGN